MSTWAKAKMVCWWERSQQAFKKRRHFFHNLWDFTRRVRNYGIDHTLQLVLERANERHSKVMENKSSKKKKTKKCVCKSNVCWGRVTRNNIEGTNELKKWSKCRDKNTHAQSTKPPFYYGLAKTTEKKRKQRRRWKKKRCRKCPKLVTYLSMVQTENFFLTEFSPISLAHLHRSVCVW